MMKNPWANSVLGSFNWGNAQPAPAKPADDEKEDEKEAPQPAAQPRPQAAQAAPSRKPQNSMNMFQEHAAMQADMYKSTQDAWQREHDSRVAQAREARKQAHEYQLEMLRQQGASQRGAASQAYSAAPSDAARQARNRSLLGMAGIGGRTLRYDGQGNRTVTPHPFGNSPLARSLLG